MLGFDGYGGLFFVDGSAPGPAHLREMSHIISDEQISCVLAEPGYDVCLIDVCNFFFCSLLCVYFFECLFKF